MHFLIKIQRKSDQSVWQEYLCIYRCFTHTKLSSEIICPCLLLQYRKSKLFIPTSCYKTTNRNYFHFLHTTKSRIEKKNGFFTLRSSGLKKIMLSSCYKTVFQVGLWFCIMKKPFFKLVCAFVASRNHFSSWFVLL